MSVSENDQALDALVWLRVSFMQCVLQLRVMKVLMKHALANDVDVNQHQTVKPAAMLSAILTTSDTGPAPAAPPSVVGATR